PARRRPGRPGEPLVKSGRLQGRRGAQGGRGEGQPQPCRQPQQLSSAVHGRVLRRSGFGSESVADSADAVASAGAGGGKGRPSGATDPHRHSRRSARNLVGGNMSDQEYQPPKVWRWEKESGGRFAAINRPIAGATHERELPGGRDPHQLYSLATPNGAKVTVLFGGRGGLGTGAPEQVASWIDIGEGEQFASGFVAINPHPQLPAVLDRSATAPPRVVAPRAILPYRAERFSAFVPAAGAERAECLSWLFWQMGATP